MNTLKESVLHSHGDAKVPQFAAPRHLLPVARATLTLSTDLPLTTRHTCARISTPRRGADLTLDLTAAYYAPRHADIICAEGVLRRAAITALI